MDRIEQLKIEIEIWIDLLPTYHDFPGQDRCRSFINANRQEAEMLAMLLEVDCV